MEGLEFPSDNTENEGWKNTEKPPKGNSIQDDLAEVGQKTRLNQRSSPLCYLCYSHTLTWRSPAQRVYLRPPLVSVTAPALANGTWGLTDRGSKCATQLGFCHHPGHHLGSCCPSDTGPGGDRYIPVPTDSPGDARPEAEPPTELTPRCMMRTWLKRFLRSRGWFSHSITVLVSS